MRIRRLVLLGNRRIGGVVGDWACLRLRGESDWLRGGDESVCLKRLLSQRIQVLLLPTLLERVTDKTDNCPDDSDDYE